MSLSLLLYGKCNAICSMHVLTLLQDLVTALISEVFLLQFFTFFSAIYFDKTSNGVYLLFGHE